MDTTELLTVDEVAEYLKLHPETIRRWIRDGRLTAHKIGPNRAGYRIPRSEVERLRDEGAR